MMPTKKCTKCGVEKPFKEFSLCRKTRSGYQAYCRVCAKRLNKDWRQKNEQYCRTKDRENHLKALYDMTPVDYNQMLKDQGNRCAICGKHRSKCMSKLAIHHDHKTGRVICLLCAACNVGLGMFHDDLELIEKAATLVRQYRKNS